MIASESRKRQKRDDDERRAIQASHFQRMKI